MSGSARAAAWAVHFYTALGAPIALAAITATAHGHVRAAFGWMALALFIDSTDGVLARRFHVKKVLPEFDGAKLDDILDYLNYAVVPVVLACQTGIVPQPPLGMFVAALPLLASAYGFCQASAKTADHFFTGFPSYWNVVIFYLYVLGFPTWLNVTVLAVFCAAVFVPVRYLYPSRSPTMRMPTYVLGGLWAYCVLVLLWQFPAPAMSLAVFSLFFPAYYLAASFWIHFRRPGRQAPGGDLRAPPDRA